MKDHTTKHSNPIVITLAVLCALLTFATQQGVAQTVFSNTFGSGSVINSGQAPTADSTSYSSASSKAITTSIGANDLNISLVATTGGLAEYQALFISPNSSAINLLSVGDYIDFTMTFINTANILTGLGSQLYIGLDNSGGVAPLLNLANGIGTAQSGGAQNWVGIVGRTAQNTASSSIYIRPAQTLLGADQELLGNSVSSSATYNNPKGGTLTGGTATSSAVLNNGGTYTLELTIWDNGSGFTVTNTLFSGAGIGGTVLSQVVGTTNATSLAYDALAFGWYQKGTVGTITNATAMDVDSILITSNTIPEPSTLMLAGAGLGLMLAVIRRRRS